MKLFRLLLSRDWKDRGSVIENVLKDEERYSWDRGRLARNEREARTPGTGDSSSFAKRQAERCGRDARGPSNRVELSKFSY